MEKFRFYKEGNNWYVDLPSWTGPKSDLLMIGGADTMLDIISNNGAEVTVFISEKKFDGATELTFKSFATDIGEGAYYLLETYEGNTLNMSVFLCDVTKFVFGKFPEKLFIAPVSTQIEETKIVPKIIFGLTPFSVLINGIIMTILAGISWSIAYLKQIPEGYKFTDAKLIKDLKIDVAWYYDMPFILLGMILLFSWIEYKFKFKPGDLSFKAVIYKYFYGLTISLLITWITKIIILYMFLK